MVLKGIELSQASGLLSTNDKTAILRRDLRLRSDKTLEKERRQSRPNVYVEAGYARGLRPNRTLFVEWPTNQKSFLGPSDFAGIHTIRFDGQRRSRELLKRRLEFARCELSLSPAWASMKLLTTRPS